MSTTAIEETAPEWMPLAHVAFLALGVVLACAGTVVVAMFFLAPSQLAGDILSIGGLIPGVKGWVTKPAKVLYQKVNSEANKVVANFDAAASAWFHQWAQSWASIGHEIYGLAVSDAQFYTSVFRTHGLATLSPRIVKQAVKTNTAAKEAHRAHTQAQAAQKATDTIRRHAIPQAVRAGTHPLEREFHGFEAGVRSFDKWAEHELDVTIPREVAGVRARTRELEDGAINTFKWIRTHPKSLATTAFAGAVAFALARLGAGWLRCSNWRRIGPAVCRTPFAEIEGLLGLLAAGAAISEFRELVKLAQKAEREAATVLQDIAKV